MNIITGYRGEAHITADQIRDQNQGCFGSGSYILDVGSKLEATAISATSVQLADGIISHQGCTASIPYGSAETVTIGNGTQGMLRIDLIVARYTKDAGTGVEDMELAVIQGTAAASNPSVPSYNQGSIHAGDSPVDMPLFEVALDGISIDSITQVASVVKTQADTDAEISAINNKFTRDTLSSTTMQAHSTSGTWAEYSVSNIKNYYLVGLVCTVDNTIQIIWVPYGDTSNWYIVESWDSSHRIRGGFSVDWANEKIKVRYLDAIGLTYTVVSVVKVYGFIRR